MVPFLLALITCSIFIAVITNNGCPCVTVVPSCTRILSIIPGIGAIGSPVVADVPATQKLSVVGAACGYYFISPHIYFSGNDGCIHEIFQKNEDNSWVHYNLTERSKKPNNFNLIKACISDPSCLFNPTNSTQTLLSLVDPVDGNPIHFYQYSHVSKAQWNLIDLTLMSKPLPGTIVAKAVVSPKNTKGKEKVNPGKMDVDEVENESETANTTPANIVIKSECSICLENPINILILPCKHAATCSTCLKEIREKNNLCPICRGKIVDGIEFFLQ